MCGPPGVGKSRLLARLARRSGQGWCVVAASLARVSDAQALRSSLAAMVAELGPGRRRVLILDEADRWLESILAAPVLDSEELCLVLGTRRCPASPEVHVLALRSLALDEAVALFRDRARAADVLALEVPMAGDIEALVEGLDRMPLAIEMAAAKTRSMSPATLIDRLDEQLDLLHGPTLGAGSKSLREVVARSWEELGEVERAAVRLCSERGGVLDGAAFEALLAPLCGSVGAASRLIDRLVARSLCWSRGRGSARRFGLYVAIRLVAAPVSTYVEAEAEAEVESEPERLVVEAGARWFCHAGKRTDLARRGAIRPVLVALAQAHGSAEGKALSGRELFAIGWPGERIQAGSMAGRVHTAIWTLRSLGLGERLQFHDGGYRLDPALEVELGPPSDDPRSP